MSATIESGDPKLQNTPPNVGPKNIWRIEIGPKDGMPNRLAEEVNENASFFNLPESLRMGATWGYLLQTPGDETVALEIATRVLADPVVERIQVFPANAPVATDENESAVFVLPLPGVTDSSAETALATVQSLGYTVDAIRTFRLYRIAGVENEHRDLLIKKLLCNDSIEQSVLTQLDLEQLTLGQESTFQLRTIPIREADDEQLISISKTWQLSLTLVEMQTIQQHYNDLEREPTDAELETIAQTWSEHCSHKTLAGKVAYTDENGTRHFDNMLKETIFAATQQIRAELGDSDWCVSVFKDNAGIVRFDDEFNVAFKVETHNRPSALEPYGGANTGIGGVIRDTLGTGMGAKPICNTDVFCFAPPETPFEDLPPGVMHPRMIMKGVVAGVRDYGNRMGIPTVNGAVYFDPRYIGNPLVFCGNVGLIPDNMSFKEPQPNDLIVAIGGRTGRDGIHGATFSSAELTEDSEITSGGAVQIGNAITEKMLMDVLLEARDRGLFSAVTDCGAGGFSSAVGEMGEEIGAEVWLDKAPLKYDGLSYTEIWISEAQERMVFAVPEKNWEEFHQLCKSESVEASVIGKFTPTRNLVLKYHDQQVAELSMDFLHDGRPPVVRQATYQPTASQPLDDFEKRSVTEWTRDLKSILGSLNVASKHWIIRQYDHEVQGGSVVKPLVGVDNDGPSDAAVVRPRLESHRGVAISCGMNPFFGDHDPYQMAASSIDEAIRNCVAVGTDPDRIAILDNFCWGYTDRPETLGTLVRAALACQDMAVQFRTPFISGKDSLNNEFSYQDGDQRKTISIPSTLLISAMGQVDNVRQCLTMDLKKSGNLIYQLGVTHHEMGGSHWCLVNNQAAGQVPDVDPQKARRLYLAFHAAVKAGLIRSAHDLSEGGLAAAIAEMAFAGDLGVDIDLSNVQYAADAQGSEGLCGLFSESNSRFLVEITPENQTAFEQHLDGFFAAPLGTINDSDRVLIRLNQEPLIDASLSELKQAWLSPLDW